MIGWLHGALDAQEVEKTRVAQLEKLWQKGVFLPVRTTEVPKGSKVFHDKRVDKQRDGVYKSRFICADVKRKYNPEDEENMKAFVPTPTPESHAFLEISALKHGHATRAFDVVAAFLIGRSHSAQQGGPVYMKAPPEWRPIFEECAGQTEVCFEDCMFRLERTLCGRRTAGSIHRDELEYILCTTVRLEFGFQRGVRDPYDYLCHTRKLTLVHHVDDVWCAGPTPMLNYLYHVLDEVMPRHREIQSGPIPIEGVASEVRGRTKTRLAGAMLTAPGPNTLKISFER